MKDRYRERQCVGEFIISELHRFNTERDSELLCVELVPRVYTFHHLKFPKGWGEEEIVRAQSTYNDAYFSELSFVFYSLALQLERSGRSLGSILELRDFNKEGVLSKSEFKSALRDGADLWVSDKDVDVLAMFLDLEHRKSIPYSTFNHLLSRMQVIDVARAAKVSHLAYLRAVLTFVDHLDRENRRILANLYERDVVGQPLEAEFEYFSDAVRKVAP